MTFSTLLQISVAHFQNLIDGSQQYRHFMFPVHCGLIDLTDRRPAIKLPPGPIGHNAQNLNLKIILLRAASIVT